MQINFLGPIDRVAGSCYWLKDEKLDVEFLVDCGIKQGGAREENDEWNRGEAFPFDPADLDFVVLTHAHIDHCGMVPYLYKEGFDGPVHCTVETARLAKLMLRDSANRDETPFDRCDVNSVHWDTALETSHGPFNHPFPVAEDVFVDFCRNGHILGSVSTSIKWGPPKTEEQKSIRFSGDIGPSLEDDPLHPFLRFRMRDFRADYVVMESTYGDRPRDRGEMRLHSRLAELDRELSGVVEDDGTAIIPSFAVDRTQSVLFDLHVLFARHPEKFENVDVYLTGYTAKEATQVYHQALKRTLQTRKDKVRPAWLGKQFRELFGLDDYSPATKEVSDAIVDTVFGSDDDPEKLGELLKEYPDTGNELLENFRRLHTTVDSESEVCEEIQRNDKPAIVVGPSGMCSGGSITHFIAEFAKHPSTHIALTGFQSSRSEGRKLLDLSRVEDEDRQRLSGHLKWSSGESLPLSDIRASISKLSSYSGHAGQEALVDYVTEHRTDEPRLLSDDVFLTHGNDRSRETLRDEIHEKTSELRKRNPEQAWDVDVRLPREEDTWFDLDDETWTTPRPGSNTGRPPELEADRRREMKPLEELARHRDALNELADTLAELKETYPDFDFEGRVTRETPETAYRMRGQFEDIRIELTRLATDEPKALEVDAAKIKELSFVEPLRNTITREPQPVVAFEAVVEHLRDYLETRLRALQSATQKTDTLRENPGDDTAPTAAE